MGAESPTSCSLDVHGRKRWSALTTPLPLTYILATPMIETGGTYMPKSENLNYSVEAAMSRLSDT